ncbi:retrotransposon protein, putative, ty1-copia subclass [Tanacetum coccineum]
MVCSMMSQTTLPKSFWDYALEFVARILNMVPTKKVESTIRSMGDLNEPANYKVALSDPEFDKWLKAINMKMKSIKDNEVWDLVDLPLNGKTVGSKWLFKKKTDIDRAVHTYKARLVAKGFTQTLGIDYEETFSPIADIRAIRILIAIAAFYDYEIWQIDVKTAFLNGYLSKENIKSYLGSCFAIKDLGEAAYILGIKIYRDRSKRLISLCQSAYIEKILKRFFMENSKRESISMQEKLKLSKSQDASTPAEVLLTGRVQSKASLLPFAEAEYIAPSDASKEAVWVRKSIVGLGVVPTIEEPIKMYYDIIEAITIANESRITKGARHYRAKVYYLREVIEYGDVKLEKVHTNDNLADHFTKSLAFPKHSEHTKNIGMLPVSNLM